MRHAGAPRPRSRGFGFGGPMRYGRGYGPGYGGGYGVPRSGGGCGCFSGMAALIALLVAVVLFVPTTCMSFCSGRRNTSSSTSQTSNTSTSTAARTREKLSAEASVESDKWLDDQAGWLDDQQMVVDAMRSFYEQTGVQPYLVIADSINGNKDYATGDAEQYLRGLYDELFDDDGHLILLFCEAYENEYDPYLLVGADAQQVVDAEGENLIYEAIDRWYTDNSLNDDEYFARIFIASANALMYGTDFSEFG